MNLFDELRVRWYDFIHNVDTRTKVPLANLEVVGNNKSFGAQYFPTLPKSMHVVLDNLGAIDPSTTFIDIGSGKGLILLVAACYPFRKIIGVEFSIELHRIAEQNARRYRGPRRCSNTEIVCMDAADFRFPADPLMIYFFNPFQRPVMERVLNNLASSVLENENEITLVFDKLHDRDLLMSYFRIAKTEIVEGFSIYSGLCPIQSVTRA